MRAQCSDSVVASELVSPIIETLVTARFVYFYLTCMK